MGGFLTDAQRNMLGGDIIEDRGDVIYVGIFGRGEDENGENNCVIRKIEEVEDPETGYITVRTLYPDGNNHDFANTWADRENYNYKYARAK